MTPELGPKSSPGTLTAESALTSWQTHVALGLQACKNKATDSEILRIAKLLARLAGSAESAQSGIAETTGDSLPTFTEMLEDMSHD